MAKELVLVVDGAKFEANPIYRDISLTGFVDEIENVRAWMAREYNIPPDMPGKQAFGLLEVFGWRILSLIEGTRVSDADAQEIRRQRDIMSGRKK